MQNQPLVSVIVATRNRRDDLRKCLNSVTLQNFKAIELIVIDNDSIDDSVAMVEKNFPSAKIIGLDRNLGCPGGRNIGILNSKGEILLFLDDDCKIADETIERALAHFASDKRPDIVTPRIIESGRSCAMPGDPEGKKQRYWPVFTGVAAIKRSVFENNGYYPTDFLYGGEETDLSLRLLKNNGRILYCPDFFVFHYPARNRNRNWELQGRLLNGLQILWKYAPLSRALLGTLAKPLEFLFISLQSNTFWGWLTALPKIPVLILKTIIYQRNPMGWYPFVLSEYLRTNIVSSWEEDVPVKFSGSWLQARFKLALMQRNLKKNRSL
jgi:GT2 family glycosyltransferase